MTFTVVHFPCFRTYLFSHFFSMLNCNKSVLPGPPVNLYNVKLFHFRLILTDSFDIDLVVLIDGTQFVIPDYKIFHLLLHLFNPDPQSLHSPISNEHYLYYLCHFRLLATERCFIRGNSRIRHELSGDSFIIQVLHWLTHWYSFVFIEISNQFHYVETVLLVFLLLTLHLQLIPF